MLTAADTWTETIVEIPAPSHEQRVADDRVSLGEVVFKSPRAAACGSLFRRNDETGCAALVDEEADLARASALYLTKIAEAAYQSVRVGNPYSRGLLGVHTSHCIC